METGDRTLWSDPLPLVATAKLSDACEDGQHRAVRLLDDQTRYECDVYHTREVLSECQLCKLGGSSSSGYWSCESSSAVG